MISSQLINIVLVESRVFSRTERLGTGLVFFLRTKQQQGNMGFGTWNVWSLYWPGFLTAESRELARYELDFVGVQEVKWDKEGK
jgi:hypothetical protein